MVEMLKVILLGIVEGITEWLPISSTGHMILVEEFARLNVSKEFWNMFLVVIQLGAILAVVCLYFHKLNPFSTQKTAAQRRETFSLWGKVLVGLVPAAAIGIPLDDWMEAHLNNWQVVAGALIVYGVLFILLERHNRSKRFRIQGFGQLSYKTALLIGMFQALSLVPGTSRSGATILGAMLLGCSRYVAAEYSFFLAVPVMAGASLLKMVKFGWVLQPYELTVLLVGMLTAFVVSVLAIRFLMGYIKKHDFTVFGWYRIVLGLLVILYFSLA